MKLKFLTTRASKGLMGLLLLAAGQSAFAADLLGVACQTPPPVHCADGDCAAKTAMPGNVTEPQSGPECADNRVVADVVRLDKGHTEGLESEITQRILELMVSAKGGKLQASAGSN